MTSSIQQEEVIMRLSQLNLHDPHSFLGLHEMGDKKVIRLFRPGAEEAVINLKGEKISVPQVDARGIFELVVPQNTTPIDYQIYHHSGLLTNDPYAFWPTLGDLDLHLFNAGVHYNLYEVLGAHRLIHQGTHGVRFAVWAPGAKRVSLVADFNHWDGRANPMRSLGASGIWEIFIPELDYGEKYKFEIFTAEEKILIKTDPYAFQMEQRPKTASIVASVDRFNWTDQVWMENRKTACSSRPMSIYEVHAGSWRRPYGRILNYRELAVELADYCLEMGFTHVEFMPLQEHPLDESWGYQTTGYYAVTSRFGTPEDFQWMINHLHYKGIGVIMDWVPGHFPTDDFSLGRFDGTSLYEHADLRQGFHPHWNTYIFNFGRKEVSNFLIANALFWFKKMHIDGLRVDAVASMLYLDYGRDPGSWVPNQYGGVENLEAIEFFKHLNSVVHEQVPGIIMVAEESTAFPGVTKPVRQNGLGFDMKWNMGWMNDTLRYMGKDPLFRKYHQNELTFGLLYAFSECYTLALSHDEVVHGKKSLLSKMPGDYWQQFANLRLLLSYQICQPGKKLLFMGAEIGQWNEWYSNGELDWSLLQFPIHQEMQRLVKDINHFYRYHDALFERDFDYSGFEWIDFADENNSVIAYLRKSEHETLLCIHHFTPNYYPEYYLRLPGNKRVVELFNSDSTAYGGSGKLNPQIRSTGDGIIVSLPPLATMICSITYG